MHSASIHFVHSIPLFYYFTPQADSDSNFDSYPCLLLQLISIVNVFSMSFQFPDLEGEAHTQASCAYNSHLQPKTIKI